MKRLIYLFLALCLLSCFHVHACAAELTAPAVPDSAQALMPQEDASFGDGLLSMVQKILPSVSEEMRHVLKTGLAVFGCVFLISILQSAGCCSFTAEIAGGVCISSVLILSSRSLIGLAVETVTQISEYSKLFLPVITAAASAQGHFTSATALCVGSSVFISFLSNVLRQVMIPSVNFFIAAAVANCALEESALKQIKEQMKKFSSWFLKTVLTVFLTYMSITGAVSGSADKAALKATKAAISTVVPVIGKTLADASEALLVSADIAKNAIGIYGIYAFLAVFLVPFFRIGIHYLVLKGIAAVCAVAGNKRLTTLVEDFTTAMGLLLAMTGSMCALSMIGTVCFLKGVG